MDIPIQYIIAKGEGWEQLIFLAVVFGLAILKKIFSVIKDYSEQQSDQPAEDDSAYEKPPQHKLGYHATHTYDKNAFKTIEQIRDERAAAIRARYGIPEPGKASPAPMELEPPMAEPIANEPIGEQMFSPPPIPPKPAYVPPKPKKHRPAAVPPGQPEYVQHPAYAQQTHRQPEKMQDEKPQKNILISLSSPDDLRAAILYQEILGKPLALRND